MIRDRQSSVIMVISTAVAAINRWREVIRDHTTRNVQLRRSFLVSATDWLSWNLLYGLYAASIWGIWKI
jgi:hypothetical protein